MPRTGPSGQYSLLPDTNNQQPNTTIRSSMFNGFATDVQQTFNTAWPANLLPVVPIDKGGTGAATAPGALATLGGGDFRWNWIINPTFTVNQRGGIKKPANGVYGFDRWKGHASGIEQIVEALPAGEYTLTWNSGGNGTFGGTTSTSPIKATVSAGNSSIVVPESATVVSLVAGDATTAANAFSPRPILMETTLCRYYFRQAKFVAAMAATAAGQTPATSVSFEPMRASPTPSVATVEQSVNVSGPPVFDLFSRFGFRGYVSSAAAGAVGYVAILNLDAEL